MGKLYPPIINGTIPAFSGTTLVVPFSLNKAVSKAEIKDLMIKVKTINGTVKETVNAYSFDVLNTCTATFNLTKSLYTIGQYYKVQIAFINEAGVVGHYSTVGVVKCTTKPTVSIENMSFGVINSHNYYYTGVYSQEGRDTSEKLYSSRFKVYDEDGNIIRDTGEILHNTLNDSLPYESTEEFKLTQDLEVNKSFYIQFCAKSVNGMEANSPKYRVIQKRSVKPEIETALVATLNENDGFVTLTFDSEADVILGTFLVSRASSKNGYVYEELKRFNLQSIIPESWSMLDCTVEHGVTYKYSLQQYNENGIYSERIESNLVQVKFEDSFLYDGEKQLCIKFNPKVATFKNTLAEQKTETIGSEHPFILKNGNLKYKEFSVGGLISYIMDESEQMFMTLDELGIAHRTTDLTTENIVAERQFKLSVLDWLTNGKAKIFRSPTEGNYIIRLLNVSMTPQDALGRMLHSFSATAYEIAAYTMENLEKYNLIDPSENLKEQTRWASVYLPDLMKAYPNGRPDKIELNNDRYAYTVDIRDMMPGSIVYLDDEAIMIGATGAYSAKVVSPIKCIFVDSRFLNQGMITYSYKTKAISVFGTVMDIDIRDYPARQFIGIEYRDNDFKTNLLDYIKDARTEVLKLSMARFEKRHTIDVFADVILEEGQDFTLDMLGSEPKFYEDMDCSNQLKEFDILHLYRIRLRRSDYRGYVIKKLEGTDNKNQNLLTYKGEGIYIDVNNHLYAPYTDYLYNPQDGKIIEYTDDVYCVYLDGEKIDLTEINKFEAGIPNKLNSIIPQVGIISELGYSTQIITYTFDTQDEDTNIARLNYLTALAEYEEYRINTTHSDEEIEVKYQTAKAAYKVYVKALEKAIEKYKEAYG